MTLREKQSAFAWQVARLIQEAVRMGYEVTLGNTTAPTGYPPSNHPKRLAIDINLFRDGRYISSTESHRPLGEWWERQSTEEYECAWGGRFNDGNHYSFEHKGHR